jgi:hypothetical protein
VVRALAAAFFCLSAQARAEPVAGGEQRRFDTAHGPLIVWTPGGYRPDSAGIVIYIHGFYTNLDQAVAQHRLPAQFAASGKNALYILPEAPAGPDQKPFWTDLESLLQTTSLVLGKELPAGPVVLMGHSAAHMTIVNWLEHTRLRHIILLDALYGREVEFMGWLEAMPERSLHTMTLVAAATTRWTEGFVREASDVVTRRGVPTTYLGLSRRQRNAKVLYIRSREGHMEIVTAGRTIPVVLRRAPLGGL